MRKMSAVCNTGKAAGLAEAGQQEPLSLVHADGGVMNPTEVFFNEIPSLHI